MSTILDFPICRENMLHTETPNKSTPVRELIINMPGKL